MSEEETGFKIKDKRSFDEQGELKEEKPQEEEKKSEPKAETQEKTPPKEKKERAGSIPLPEVNFTSLIFSLSSSAFLHLGEIADPESGEKKQDLPIAKQTIDTIAMLKEKTSGNLTEEEQKFIDSILTDLRWRYVKATE